MVRKYHKKAQGLSLNTIIVAAIGLAVLVILFAVFTGRIGLFNTGLDDASNNLRTCSNVCTASGYASGTDASNSRSDGAGANQCTGNQVKVSGGANGCCCTPRTS